MRTRLASGLGTSTRSRPGRSHGAGEAGVGIFQIRQQAHHPRVIGRAHRRELHAARGAVQQLHAQAGFELLHELGHGGAAHVQGGAALVKLPDSTTRAKA